jgi:hypothetical protein
MTITIKVRWTLSRAKNTEGQNRCTLKAGTHRVAVVGGDYDLLGTALAEMTELMFPSLFDGSFRYTQKDVEELYGLIVRPNGTAFLDGARGLASVEDFLEKRLCLRVTYETKYNPITRHHRVTKITLAQTTR